MAIERIIIGSTNPGKVSEWKKLLRSLEVRSIADIGNFPEPEETGSTFKENAILKAKHYAKLSHEFVLADDGGFEIDALNGAPGVKSRRILPGDKDGTDQELVDFVLDKMKNVPEEKRTAHLTAYAALADKDGKIIFEDTSRKDGVITNELEAPIISGYPYRSILYLPEVKKTYAELSDQEHERLNHRREIAKRLLDFRNKFV
jgi:XTP/dITP diphosphohydrolase